MSLPRGTGSAGTDAPLLSVRRLSRRFGDVAALERVAFEVRTGELLGLIGPNGAGKSTLMECVAGLCLADAGSVHAAGRELPAEERKELLFYVPDGIRPYPDQTAGEVLGFFLDMHRGAPKELHRLAVRLDLGHSLGKRVGGLSKGTLKRLLLAVGLLSPQPLLLLDEPFDGLDLRQTRGVMELLAEARDAGRTLLLSIHQLRDAERVCDRFVLLSAGAVVGTGTLAELRRQAGTGGGGLEEVFLALA